MKKLIIFDCDGTLVDSEGFYNAITSRILQESGLPEYTLALCLEIFAGESWVAIHKVLEQRNPGGVPEDIVPRFIRIAETQMVSNLGAVPFAEESLGALCSQYDTCVASNGEFSNIIKSLEVTGLQRFFEGDRVFSKSQVENPKPAPDLFLFACTQMETAPEDAIIVEDSVPGVLGAKAAGIDVLGYVGVSHDQEAQRRRLYEAGAVHVMDSLHEIEKYLNTDLGLSLHCRL